MVRAMPPLSLFVLLLCYSIVQITSFTLNRHSSITYNSIYFRFSNSLSRRYIPLSSVANKVIDIADADTNADAGTDKNKVDNIIRVLKTIIDPDAGDDIYSIGYIKGIKLNDDGDVIVEFDATGTSLSRAIVDKIMETCRNELISKVGPWIRKVNINETTSKEADSITSYTSSNEGNKASTVSSVMSPVESVKPNRPAGMSKVKHIIAVSSCKGGVGKSTVSVNLAYTLKLAGASVGILDADIYGPSLPTMTKPSSSEIIFAKDQLQPLEYQGIKLMSMGFINKGAAIMRGPMVNQILNQFVSLCNWGDLDYLIVDMPPGTGDIQLTLAQIMDISAAVIVTTPQRLSFVDVVKGIDMFDTVNIPCVAVVENMAEYVTYNFTSDFYNNLEKDITSSISIASVFNPEPSNIATVVSDLVKASIVSQQVPLKVFGDGHTKRLREMWGIENIVSLPLLEGISKAGDNGIPYVVANPESFVAATMLDLGNKVVNEIKKIKNDRPTVVHNKEDNSIVYNGSKSISSYDLRCECRCATCVEELTGKRLLNPETVPRQVKPLGMAAIGRYAMSVDWSDGHKSLFPYRAIAGLVESTSSA